MRSRVLVIHPSLTGGGGADQVAAWTLQALAREYRVTLYTWRPVDVRAVDRFCETDLAHAEIEYLQVPATIRRALGVIPARLSLLETAWLLRYAKRLDRERHFDCVLSTFNEMDFGRVGLQYIHHPWSYLPRPDEDLAWYSRPPLALALYHELCRRIGAMTPAGMARNVSVANSSFIAARVGSVISEPCRVVFPPVPGRFAPLPWQDRCDEIVCLGRLAPEKRTLDVIDIVERVRAGGVDVHLKLVGIADVATYAGRVRDRLRSCADWATLEIAPPRERVLELLHRARYGIHAMRDEHFGIAVAEMLLAGCIVFAHDSGGPAEILGGAREVLFRDDDEAVDKIAALLRSQEARSRVSVALAERRAAFGVETFVAEMKRSVAETIRLASGDGRVGSSAPHSRYIGLDQARPPSS